MTRACVVFGRVSCSDAEARELDIFDCFSNAGGSFEPYRDVTVLGAPRVPAPTLSSCNPCEPFRCASARAHAAMVWASAAFPAALALAGMARAGLGSAQGMAALGARSSLPFYGVKKFPVLLSNTLLGLALPKLADLPFEV